MKSLILNRNFYLMLSADAVLVALAYGLSFLVRFEWAIPSQSLVNLKTILPFIIPLKLLCFLYSAFTGACGDIQALWI